MAARARDFLGQLRERLARLGPPCPPGRHAPSADDEQQDEGDPDGYGTTVTLGERRLAPVRWRGGGVMAPTVLGDRIDVAMQVAR